MISKQEILDYSQEWQLRANVVEKDYVIGWLLWGLGNFRPLSDVWIFKGGTCLKKCFIETYRFSEDLDFTVLPGGPVAAAEIEKLLPNLLKLVADASGINFSVQAPRLKDRPSGAASEGRVYYQGPLLAPTPASVKLDICSSEVLIRPPVLRPIAHPYTDTCPDATIKEVRCYGFEELFAEKIRALGERYRPRDLYDVINLYRRPDLHLVPTLIRSVLDSKCKAKGLTIPTYAFLADSPLRAELESEWANMLAHQLPALPPIEGFLSELEPMFNWLNSSSEAVELPAITNGGNDLDTTWSPPPTVWHWGQGIPLESVRFAAANRLCVDLTYGGSLRRIEPYSLRRTKAGNILLYARKVQTGEPRAYRVDRIQGIAVTNQPFIPKYRIEFSAVGPMNAPSLTKSFSNNVTRHSYSLRSRTNSHPHYGPIYIIQCPYCFKKFERKSQDYTLHKHKDAFGLSTCHGSGSSGYLVEMR
jgi:predicted nucleotidyltransferase component of viral defense system